MSSLLIKFAAIFLLVLTIPLYPILIALIKLESPGPFIFKQKRLGKNKRIFTIYKIRTMYHDKPTKRHINIPTKNDKRNTTVGRYLRLTRLDELPQLLNIVKGNMTFVGPRPFPLQEAKNIADRYDKRYEVLPGLTGSWVIYGFHSQAFQERMNQDCLYVTKKSFLYDLSIFLKTIAFMLKREYLKHSEE